MNKGRLLILILFILITTVIPFLASFLFSGWLPKSQPALSGGDREALKARIMAESGAFEQAPTDARVDRVWHLIPGYNGVRVNVNRTIRQTEQYGSIHHIKWVLEEVPAQRTIEQFPNEPIYRGNPQKPMAALMINVAWGEEYLEEMLNILDQNHVRATFFIDGSWASKHPDALKTIYRQGHEIGNHAFSHPDMSRLSRAEMAEEIARTDKVIRDTLGIKPALFAPPSGDFNDLTVRTAAELGYRTILWTIDTVDWRHPAPALVVEKIGNGISNGYLVLMHPTDSSVGALPGMIARIRAKHIELGTVSEVMSPRRFPPVEVEPFF